MKMTRKSSQFSWGDLSAISRRLCVESLHALETYHALSQSALPTHPEPAVKAQRLRFLKQRHQPQVGSTFVGFEIMLSGHLEGFALLVGLVDHFAPEDHKLTPKVRQSSKRGR